MSKHPIKLLAFGAFGLSLFLSSSPANAQYSSDIVVPTTSGGGGSTDSTIYSGDRYPSGGSVGSSVNTNARFVCQQFNGQNTVMYQPQSQPGQYFAWATPRTLGGGWDTARRCQTIAQRLESYRGDGLLELQTSVMNGENVVCVTTEANSACRIVFTVPREKDPYVVRNSVFENLASADNGQQTTAVNTYRDRNGNQINQIYRTIVGGNNSNNRSAKSPIALKPFLDRADGGTGQGLRNGVRIGRQQTRQQSGARLIPGRFK
jgi:Circadian oscillating protein COP23